MRFIPLFAMLVLACTAHAQFPARAIKIVVPYAALKDLAPVSLIGTSPLYLVAHPSVPVNTLQELVAYAKANPGKLNYGSSGIGSIHHLATEALKAGFGIDLVHVPYKGTGQS